MATDCSQGRTVHDRDLSCRWRFEDAATPMSATTSSEMPSSSARSLLPLVVLNEPLDDRSDDESADLIDDDEEEEVEDFEEDDIDDGGMKIVHFPSLKRMVERFCRCRECGSDVTSEQDTLGTATDLCLTCIPKDKRFASHAHCMTAEELTQSEGNNDPFTTKQDDKKNTDSAGNHLINTVLALGMQQLGMGMNSVVTFLGTIGVRASLGDTSQWKKIQDRLGVAEEEVKEEVLKENLAAAVEAAEDDGETRGEDGRIGLTCSVDGGWQKRSSGRTHDSPSGHNLLVDCRTKRILDCVVCSEKCAVCDRKKKGDVEVTADDDSGTVA